MYLTADDGRRNAAAEADPLMLIGPDIIHYAELLIRFHDHRVLSPGYQFWGNLADYLNRIMHLPEKPGRQNDSAWSEFNGAVAMAVGYVRDESPATDEQKLDLLRKYFPPAPGGPGPGPDGRRYSTVTPVRQQAVEHVLAAVSGTVFRSDADDMLILLRDDPYVIRVDAEGDTESAYLVTVPPADIAAAMDADAGGIGGWSTGWTC